MRALANDREITATLGVPVRRVEAAAWFGSGLLSGAAGLLLSNLVGLDAATLTFLVISSLAAALIARLSSLVVTFVAARIVIGLVNALVTPILSISQYRDMTPFVLATIALLLLSGSAAASHSPGRLAREAATPEGRDEAATWCRSGSAPATGARWSSRCCSCSSLFGLRRCSAATGPTWSPRLPSTRSWRSASAS